MPALRLMTSDVYSSLLMVIMTRVPFLATRAGRWLRPLPTAWPVPNLLPLSYSALGVLTVCPAQSHHRGQFSALKLSLLALLQARKPQPPTVLIKNHVNILTRSCIRLLQHPNNLLIESFPYRRRHRITDLPPRNSDTLPRKQMIPWKRLQTRDLPYCVRPSPAGMIIALATIASQRHRQLIRREGHLRPNTTRGDLLTSGASRDPV